MMTASSSLPLNDQLQRDRALDAAASFIVQAPAGSGKTSLLVLRYLSLLARVNSPEEIIAITFTRKAASEMRHRIIDALSAAAQDVSHNDGGQCDLPLNKNAQSLLELARRVLQQDARNDWQLLENSSRLRLQTIDSLCYQLAAQAPLVSGLGIAPDIASEIEIDKYCKEAAYAVLSELENPNFAHRVRLENLLLQFDNNIELFTNLCCSMLKRREQWLPYIVAIRGEYDATELRRILEQGLATLARETIELCQQNFPRTALLEVVALFEFARANLESNADGDKYKTFSSKVDFTLVDGENNAFFTQENLVAVLAAWRQIAAFLMTKEDGWRKLVDKKVGFPAPSSCSDKNSKVLYQTMKQRFATLVASLSEQDVITHALQEVKNLPPPFYTTEQWQAIDSLIELLPLLVANLDVTLRAAGIADYTAVALAAGRALGTSDNPEDLALRLDYRIKHLLVDEFQDVSLAQYRLLQQLTAGWEAGDGRTLFLVGDPMQSIYRFRQAEVGLFLRAEKEGVGSIQLEKLQLTTNFRSTAKVVAWINDNFAKILPSFEDVALGCVPFCRAFAAKNNNEDDAVGGGVSVRVLVKSGENSANSSGNDCVNDDNAAVVTADVSVAKHEAQYVVAEIKKIMQQDPNGSIAILVSARSHLNEIIPTLKNEAIFYNAIELESLISSATIRDLCALLRALTNLTDRIAWLAILRAPWCGLSLHDLYVIANSVAAINNGEKRGFTIWENLNLYRDFCDLSMDGKERLARFLPIINEGIKQRGRRKMRAWLENVWREIGGAAAVANIHELEHAQQFFRQLEEEGSSGVIDIVALEERLEHLYLSGANPQAQVEIMTIHKAKGLEFDHVIVSGLHNALRSDEQQLLLWLERASSHDDGVMGGSDLLLAPLKAIGSKESAVYRYLRKIEQEKDYYEDGRLLYVAATRAKKSLCLIACAKEKNKEKEEKKNAVDDGKERHVSIKFSASSLASQLISCFKEEWLQNITAVSQNKRAEIAGKDALSEDVSTQNKIITTRLACGWQELSPDAQGDVACESRNYFTIQRNRLQDDAPALIGTIIHKCLQQLGQNFCGDNKYDVQNYCQMQRNYWQKLLLQNGLHRHLDKHLRQINNAVKNMLSSGRGLWILAAEHKDIRNEYAVAVTDNAVNGEKNPAIKHFVIDRTFIDKDSGKRWIIDYKTATPFALDNCDEMVSKENRTNLSNFLQQQKEIYAPQLEQYAEVFKGEEVAAIMLGLYFPLCDGWCEWASNS